MTITHNYSGKSLAEQFGRYGKGNYGFCSDWWKEEGFVNEKPSSGAYEIVLHTELINLDYQEQLDKLPGNEVVLHPAILAEAIIDYYKNNKEILLKDKWLRTSSVFSNGHNVCLGRFSSQGIDFCDWGNARNDRVGIASSK